MAASKHIQFQCPNCLQLVTAEQHESGKRMDCQNCGRSLLVPSQSMNQELFEDIFDTNGEEQPATGERDAESDKPKSSPNTESSRTGSQSPAAEGPNFKFSSADEAADVPTVSETDDLQSESGTDATDIFGIGDVEPPTGEAIQPQDPFKIDEDAPVRIDGVTDLFKDIDNVFGVRCRVCDTRIHVSNDQVGSTVECPICFSKVKITPPDKNPKSEQRWLQPQPKQSHIVSDDEFRLSEPVKRPKVEIPIDPNFGLEPVDEDLLAPKKSEDDSEDVHSPRTEEDEGHAVGPANTGGTKSRKERYEEARKRQQESEKPRFTLGSGSKQKNRKKLRGRIAEDGYPDFRFSRLTSSLSEMLRSHGLVWRAAVSTLLIGIGNAILLGFDRSYQAQADPAIGDWILKTAVSTLLVGFPYLVGFVVLLYVCSYVFRESAYGNLQVFEWKPAGWADLRSTFLLFSFSYLVAGLPVLFFPILVLPFRFLLAPPLLLAAWYNKAPFGIVAIDAFEQVTDDAVHWRKFYSRVLILILFAWVAHLLMNVSVPLLDVLTSTLGAALTVLVTIAFSALTGWHCGRILQRLEKKNEGQFR